jgi:MFS family permease
MTVCPSTESATAPRSAGLYHGWLVVAAAFLIALFAWGIGFYGPGIYLIALGQRLGVSTAEISSAITMYYLLGATLILLAGTMFDRLGARRVVVTGAGAMACGVVGLAFVTQPWQVYAAFAVMSVGWATMSGAAINIIVAPWFDRRRGLAVSFALNGASAGGVVVAPLLIVLIGRLDLALALSVVVGTMLAVLLPVVVLVLRPRRAGEHDQLDDPSNAAQPRELAAAPVTPWRLPATLGSASFQTISLPFALGLTAQVGLLTHQAAYLSPILGTVAAGWAISLTTLSAVVGRIATGFVVDQVDRRVAACANFVIQIAGLALLMSRTSVTTLYAGCILFGLGVGNMISLPGLIVQHESPPAFHPDREPDRRDQSVQLRVRPEPARLSAASRWLRGRARGVPGDAGGRRHHRGVAGVGQDDQVVRSQRGQGGALRLVG